MPIYKAHSIQPPTLTLHSHSFTIQIRKVVIVDSNPIQSPIGQLVFTKHAEETWIAAQSRFVLAIQQWIDTYEEAQDIDAGVNAWLQTQEWQT